MMRENCLDYPAMGQHVRALRQARRLTQEALAAQIGVSTSFIGHIERAEKLCSLETVVRLSDAFDVPADYLLRGKKLTCDRQACPLYAELSEVFARY